LKKFAAKSTQGSAKEIKITDEWNSENFLRYELHTPRPIDYDYDNIPYPLLKNVIANRDRYPLRQGPIQSYVQAILQALFGGLYAPQPPVPPAPATTTMKTTTTPDPFTQKLEKRTRRKPKYNIKGDCKNKKGMKDDKRNFEYEEVEYENEY
jgi:hypothetical protein